MARGTDEIERPVEHPSPGTDPAVPAEVARIRAVYRERDRSRPRGAAVAEAYRRLNAERLGRMRAIIDAFFPEERPRLLDVGCGGGYDLSRWQAAGWPADRLAGTDLVAARLDAARVACPGADLRLSEGTIIPFADDSVDVATAVTVFSSILSPSVRTMLFADIERVVRPGGLILVYDFVIRKPTNPHVVGMSLVRLAALGRPPTKSVRLSPLLQAVAVAAVIHPRLADVAMRVAPPTHRLSYWLIPGPGAPSTTSAR